MNKKNSIALDLDNLPREAFSNNLLRFARINGSNILDRTQKFYDWWNGTRVESGLAHYFKSLDSKPLPDSSVRNFYGDEVSGVNFGNQDYLGLASHEAIAEAAIHAIEKYGPHSAGSGPLQGNTNATLQLEDQLCDALEAEKVILYPTGWSAGFGAIAGLVRSKDYILLDELSHQCLQQGAYAATQKVTKYEHLNVGQVEEELKSIREKDSHSGILVVTEGLFSMDSDIPDIQALQGVCHEYDATLMLDVAHDFGSTGKEGMGSLELNNMLGKVDIVMGSFSKTFASIGGFVASKSISAMTYLQGYSGPYTFSNMMSPVQAAVISKSLDIVRSKEGVTLRKSLIENSRYLRKGLMDCGLEVTGTDSAIVPVIIGDETSALLANNYLFKSGVSTNMIDFPGVPLGKARFRLQVMATHSKKHIDIAVPRIADAINSARHDADRFAKC